MHQPRHEQGRVSDCGGGGCVHAAACAGECRWFEQTKDMIPNHILAIPHPNAAVGKK